MVLLVALGLSQTTAPEPQWPGPKPEGFLLPTGWRLAPTGIQVPLPDTLPMSLALHPDGEHLFRPQRRFHTAFGADPGFSASRSRGRSHSRRP